MLNSNILKEITSKQNKLLDLFNLLNNDNKANSKNKKTSTNTKKASIKKDENKSILLEYMGYIDDKLFKKYSNSKNFSSFINEFDRATNEEDKKKQITLSNMTLKRMKIVNTSGNYLILLMLLIIFCMNILKKDQD